MEMIFKKRSLIMMYMSQFCLSFLFYDIESITSVDSFETNPCTPKKKNVNIIELIFKAYFQYHHKSLAKNCMILLKLSDKHTISIELTAVTGYCYFNYFVFEITTGNEEVLVST
jgi:hypothetical protein